MADERGAGFGGVAAGGCDVGGEDMGEDLGGVNMDSTKRVLADFI